MQKFKMVRILKINLRNTIKTIKAKEDMSSSQCLQDRTTFRIHKNLCTTDLTKIVQFRLIIQSIKI